MLFEQSQQYWLKSTLDIGMSCLRKEGNMVKLVLERNIRCDKNAHLPAHISDMSAQINEINSHSPPTTSTKQPLDGYFLSYQRILMNNWSDKED
jgi:hypothetical protein